MWRVGTSFGLFRLRCALPARIKLILNLLAAFRASPHGSRRASKAIRLKWQGYFRTDNEPACGNQIVIRLADDFDLSKD
jgi:hypothetical protein